MTRFAVLLAWFTACGGSLAELVVKAAVTTAVIFAVSCSTQSPATSYTDGGSTVDELTTTTGDTDASTPDASLADASTSPQRKMAITIDDLPVAFFSSQRNDAHRRDIVDRLCELISDRQLPVTGFVIGGNHAKQPELMRTWIEAGIEVGNHTWSHPNLKKVGLKAYLAELDRGHRTVAKLVGDDEGIPFRYPFLREGFDPEVRDAIRQHLEELGSPRAPVTVDTNDWYFARDYTAALKRGDRAQAQRYVQPWRWNLEESVERAEWLARELFDREPPQILLIHANELNADHLGSFLDWLEERGYRFVPLSEALSDPAYHEPNESVTPMGDSLWLQLRRSRQIGSNPSAARPRT